MWKSRELALVILLAVVSFVYSVLVSQLPNLITGIMGLTYFFIIGHAIFVSFGLLMYGGRRWRFLLQSTLVAILLIPTFQHGTPFDVLARTPILASSFFADLIFNSVYPFFHKHNKMIWWAILSAVGFLLLNPFFTMLNMFLFYSPEALSSYVTVYLLLFPVTMIEAIFGGIIAHRIWRRVQQTSK